MPLLAASFLTTFCMSMSTVYLESDNVGNTAHALVSKEFTKPTTISHESQDNNEIGVTSHPSVQMFDCPTGIAPTVTAFALSASCTDGIPNDDAYLQISAATDATHYDYSEGSTYIGTGFAAATGFDPATDLPLQFGTLNNPGAATDYTIRIFNGDDACFTDVVVTLNLQDCTVGCECDEYIFLNDTQEESVHKFLVVGDTVSEILAPNGGSWLQNIIDPHGISMDLNGFLYIGDRTLNASDQRALWRLTCDGEVVNDDVTGTVEFSTLNLYVTGNTLYSYDVDGIKAWNSCDGTLLETYDPEIGPCEVTNADRDDAWGFVRTDSVFYGSRYIDIDLPDGTPVVIFDVYEFSTDYTTWGPDCSIPIFFSDTLYSPGLERIWGLSRDPLTGNFLTVATEHSVSGRPSIVYMWDDQGNLLDTLRDDTNDQTGFAGTRGMTYSPTLNKFIMATQNGDCMSLVSIDNDGELQYDGPLIPFVDDSQGKGLNVVKECCPTNNRQTIDQIYCVSDESEPIYLNEVYDCLGTICEGIWTPTSVDGTVTYESCDQSVTVNGSGGCATFTKSSDGTGANAQCDAFEITLNVCFKIIPSPEIAVTDNDCTAATPGAFTVTTACEAGSTIEWSTDSGTTWSTTVPAYDTVNEMTVIARCVDADGCLSVESAAVTTAPTDCCATPPCFNITIQQN